MECPLISKINTAQAKARERSLKHWQRMVSQLCPQESSSLRIATVQALQTLLQGVADELQDPGSVVHKAGKSKRQQLVNLIDDCNTDLRDLERYILQYKSLKSAKPRLRDRLRFGIKPISQIRLKLSQHTDNLNLFLAHVNTTSLARLEQASASSAGLLGDIKARLDALCQQVESGQKDASLLDAKSNWVGLKRELVGERVTDRDVTCNRNSIQEYITTWLNATSHHQRTEPGGNRGTTKRTSSMIPWTPMGQIGPLAQPLPSTPMYFPRTATPSIPDLMWECTGRDTPNTDVDFAQSEDTSQCSADVFSSQSFQSSRVTTPDILGTPVERIPSEIAYFSGEKSDCTGTEGIESLIDELDAFALDLSRASTPDAHSSNLGEESTEIQYYDLDQNLEQIHPANTLLHAPGATTLKRRILTRPLALTLEEAFVGGMKKKRIRGRLLPDTNDADTFTIRESTIEVHYPPAARQGLKIEFPGVAIDPDGFIQDLHFIVVWVSYLSYGVIP